MNNITATSIVTGIVSGAMYLLPMFSGGEIASMFALLPLLYTGLGYGVSAFIGASLAAVIVIAITAVDAVLGFLLVNALPAFIFIRLALPRPAEVMPIGKVMAHVSEYAALLLALLFIQQAWTGQSLAQLLQVNIDTSTSELTPETVGAIKHFVEAAPFLLLAFTGWFLLLLVYGNALLANMLLKSGNKSLRPSLGLGSFSPPAWLLGAVALMALGAVIGGHTISLMAKTLFLLLLFPYFLFGLSLIHRATELWPSRGFVRVLLYLFIAAMLWPALLVAIYGLWQHAAMLSRSMGRK